MQSALLAGHNSCKQGAQHFYAHAMVKVEDLPHYVLHYLRYWEPRYKFLAILANLTAAGEKIIFLLSSPLCYYMTALYALP